MQTFVRSNAFVKSLHTIIFLFINVFLAFFLYEVITDRITSLTWMAVAVVLTEGVVLMVNGWRCPLAIYGEKVGAVREGESDLYLPKWFAKLIFPIYTSVFVGGLLLLVIRLLT